MKNNWMKYVGATLGICLTLSFAPSFANADENNGGKSLGLEINILNEQEGKAQIVDIEVDNVPIVGNLDVKVPAENPVTSNDSENSVADVSIEESILGDINAKVLTEKNVVTENEVSSKAALVEVTLEESIVDEAAIEVLSQEKVTDEEGESSNEQVVHIGVEDHQLKDIEAKVIYDGSSENGEISQKNSGVVHVETDHVPLVGDTHIGVLDEHERETLEEQENTSSLVTVESDHHVLDGLVDDLKVSVLENNSHQKEGATNNNGSLATVETETPLTNEVELDVLLSEDRTGDNSSTYDKGLVELTTEELPHIGETHIGILDEHISMTEEASKENKGVLQVALDSVPLVGDVYVGLFDKHEQDSLEAHENASSLATVELDHDVLNGFLDDLKVSVLENGHHQKNDAMNRKNSLVSIGLETPITDEVVLDVLLSKNQTSNEFDSYDKGLVELNATDLPILGETHIGVFDEHVHSGEEGDSFSTGVIQTDITNGPLTDISLDVIATDGYMNEDGIYVKESGVSLGLDNQLTGNVQVDVLTIESFLPTEVVNPPVDNGNGETSGNNGNGEIPGNNGNGETPGDDGNGETPGNNGNGETLGDQGNIETSSGHNHLSLLDTSKEGKSTKNNSIGPMLPKTGGFFDSLMLVAFALILLTSGFAIRRIAY